MKNDRILFIGLCAVLYLVAQSCPALCNPRDCSPPGSSVHGDSAGKNTGVGCHALLQGIFLTQGSNPGLPHCRWIPYHLSHQGSPLLTISSAQLLSCVRLFVPHGLQRARLPSITNSQSVLKLMSIKSVMPSNHLILCHPLLLLPSIFASIRVFSNESVLCIRWPKCI